MKYTKEQILVRAVEILSNMNPRWKETDVIEGARFDAEEEVRRGEKH